MHNRKPLEFWIQQALPQVYDDSLSYTELLNRVVHHLNDNIKGFNHLSNFTQNRLNEQDNEIKKTNINFKRLRFDFRLFTKDIERRILPQNIDLILNEWWNNGKLASIINDEVFNMKANLEDLENLRKENETSINDVNQKINEISVNASSLGITEMSNSQEIELALNTLNDGTTVNFNGTYYFNRTVTVQKSLKFIGNNATFIFDPDFTNDNNDLTMFVLENDGFTFDNITFHSPSELESASRNNCYLWFRGGKNKVTQCDFYDLPRRGSNFNGAIAFMTGGIGFNVASNCYFENCPGGVFSQQSFDLISNCRAFKPHDVSFVLNSPNCDHSTITSCFVNNPENTCSIHIGVEQGASNFIITNNQILGIKDGMGIGAVNVGGITFEGIGGIIAHNIIDGNNLPTTNPVAGITIHKFYSQVKIHHNIIRNMGSGNSSSSYIMLEIDLNAEVELSHNTIQNNSTNYTIYIGGSGGEAQLNFFKNNIYGRGSGIGIICAGASYNNAKIFIQENNFYNFSEGIQATQLATINEFQIENNEFRNCSAAINIPNVYGTFLQNNFNQYGFSRPHKLSKNKPLFYFSSHANMIPTNGTFKVLDEVFAINPGVGASPSAICITSGTPGTWANRPNLI